MTSHIVYVDVPRAERHTTADHSETHKLFTGQKLWFAHTIPQRQWLIENARLNGATIVDIDKQADIKLVDHARKNQAPGTHSYRYVELSIRRGELEDLASHAVGAPTRVSRPVGSTVTAPRSGRVPYTEADDQFLWNWMIPFEENGGAYKGNEVYKQIEQANPRHTFQSWRDRWLKSTRYQKRSVTNSHATRPHHVDGPEPEPDQVHIARESSVLEPEQEQPRTSVSPKKKRRPFAEDEGEPASEVKPRRKAKRPVQSTPRLSVESAAIEPSTERSPAERPVERTEPETQAREPENEPDVRSREGDAHHENEDTESVTESEKQFLDGITGPFSKEDSLELYRLVPELTNMTPGQFLDVWRDMASSKDFKHHSAEEWKHWFEYRVLPDYCREKDLRIEEVAPYLFMQQDNGAPDEELSSDTGDAQHGDRPAESLEQAFACSNCYASEAEKWHYDKKGRALCKPCAVFLRTHGVPRPSTMGLDALGEAEDSEPQGPQTPLLLSPPKFAITPIVSSIKVSPKLPSVDLHRAVRDESKIPEGQCETRSPSFQPESPILSRPPEPNEARKRSAGRVTQSQSTQGTNQSSNESQAQTNSHSLGLVMGEAQSKEAQPPPEEHQDTRELKLDTAAPPFSFATTHARHRQRLRDDPRNLDIQQDSSLSTDKEPPREPPAIHLSTETEGLESSPPFAPSPSRSQGSLPPQPENFSPLFVAQDDQDEEFKELEIQDTEQQDIVPPDDEQLTSPLRLNLMSEGQWDVPAADASSRSSSYQSEELDVKPPVAQIRGGSSGTSAYGPEEEDDEDGDEADPKPPISGVRETSVELGSQSFETSRETMDQWETAPEQPRKRNREEERLSTQALFDGPDIDADMSTYLEIPEPEGGWDSILGSEAADTIEDDHQPTTSSKKSLHKQRAPGTAQHVQPDIDIKQENRTHLDPRPPPHADAENIDYNDPERGEWVMDKWEEQEKARYPNLRNMERILYKAAYCTSCDFPRASELVDRFLEQLRRKRRRTSTSSYAAVSEAELVVPEDMPGVWTDEDDRLLFSTKPADVQRIFDKHGHRAYDRRIDFLDAQAPE